MAALDDIDQVIEQCQLALDEFVKGDPEPMQSMFSHREDVSLNNPFSPPARGWEQVAATMERAASQFRDGVFVSVEIIEKHVSPEFAYVVEIERGEVGSAGHASLIEPRTSR